MNTNNYGTRLISENNMDTHPLWRYDDETDLYYPIFSIDEFPEYSRSLFIRAKFFSPNGIILKGYLVGAINIYCIRLFFHGKTFVFNKNLPDFCLKDFNKLIELLPSGKNTKITDIFPVKYETTIDLEGYQNITGEFDAFEEMKKQDI